MPKKPTVSMNKKDKNPKGGLTQAGRDKYNRATGSNLKAPVGRAPKTPEEMRRQGSFLVRMGSAAGPLKGILEYTDAPIVSSDIVTNSHSCIFDSDLTMSMGSLVKVLGWYDNEWGYSNRLVDLALHVVK